MDSIRVAIFNLFFYLFSLCMAFVCYGAAKLSTREAMWRIISFYGHTMRKAIRFILGGTVQLRGTENIDTGGPHFVVAKHLSELDIIMLAALVPNVSAVAMEELTRYPFIGVILKKLGVVLVAVDAGPQGRTAQVIEGARRILFDEKRPMVIYPEGELMKIGARERYKSGAGRIYEALDVPAFPVATSLGVIWPQRRWRKHIGKTAAIEILEPIPPGMPFDEFMHEIEERIETRSMELIREHASGRELEEAEYRYSNRLNNHDEPVPLRNKPRQHG